MLAYLAEPTEVTRIASAIQQCSYLGGKRPEISRIVLHRLTHPPVVGLPVAVHQQNRSAGIGQTDFPRSSGPTAIVLEVNLVKTWKALVDRCLERPERPISINPKTL